MLRLRLWLKMRFIAMSKENLLLETKEKVSLQEYSIGTKGKRISRKKWERL